MENKKQMWWDFKAKAFLQCGDMDLLVFGQIPGLWIMTEY